MDYGQNYDSNGVEAIMEKLRASLKRRGAEGIRGLGRHFKVNPPLMHHATLQRPVSPDVACQMTTSSIVRGCVGRLHDRCARQIVDVNRNGQLDLDEFEKCCRLNNLGLNDKDMKIIFVHFDRDRSGGISYDEFLRAVRGRLSPVRKQIVKKLFDVLDK